MDAKSIIAEAKRPERTVALCLRADLVAELEDTQRQLAEAREAKRSNLADDGGLAAINEAIDRIKAEAKEHTIVFRFRAMNRYELSQLTADNPPREGNRFDKANGYNVDALVWGMIRKCCYDPNLSDAEWDSLMGTSDEVGNGLLSPGQWQQLQDAVEALNFAKRDIPF